MLTRPAPDWVDVVRAWDGQRIRKVVRRARGAEWRRAEALPGLTVRNGSAEVRVFPPIPVDDWPRDLARLQVGGTELDDPTPAPVRAGTPLVLLSPNLELTAGKAMAQAAHAAQLGWRASDPAAREAWADHDFDLAVRTATSSAWLRALATGAPVVHDAGFTEVAPGSQTAAAVLPWLGGWDRPSVGR